MQREGLGVDREGLLHHIPVRDCSKCSGPVHEGEDGTNHREADREVVGLAVRDTEHPLELGVDGADVKGAF
jgi:hypothetical protein